MPSTRGNHPELLARTSSMASSKYKVPNRSTLVTRFLIEFVALTLLVYPMIHIYVFLQGDLQPYQRGFYCDDQAIKHPDLPEEISVGECVLIWALIVVLLVPAIEFLHVTVFDHGEQPSRVCNMPWVLIELYRVMGYFTLGALCTLLTTEMAKYKIGRLRPYFLTVCDIDLTDNLCKDEFGYNKFVTEYTCRGDRHHVNEASKSFLSGHSSFSFYCATFLIVYIHARLSKIPVQSERAPYRCTKVIFRGLKILRPFFQFGIFCLAFYICLTRISDYKHHPGDVLMGAFLGTFVAIILLVFLVDLFHRPRIFRVVTGVDGDNNAILTEQRSYDFADAANGGNSVEAGIPLTKSAPTRISSEAAELRNSGREQYGEYYSTNAREETSSPRRSTDRARQEFLYREPGSLRA